MISTRSPLTAVALATAAVLALPTAGLSATRHDAAATGVLTGVLDPGLPTTGPDPVPVVVTGPAGPHGLGAAVTAAGGSVGRPLPLVGGVAARVPAAALPALAARPGVTAVTADRTATVSGLSYDEGTSASAFAWSSGTAQTWSRSTGQGVGVALLDTGVAPVGDLAGRVVSGPDLSGEDAPQVDSYGHGTVMAGLVAGSGAAAGAAPRTGAAPGAHVVSVKVAGENGATDVSTVLAGMHWVAAFRETYGIRVLTLAWGVPSTQDPRVDPLNHAVQRLTSLGVLVVVSAGNSGPTTGTVLKPADDPRVLTVGAYDDKGDAHPSNDTVPQWSSRGPTAQGLVKPDLVAPGRLLVAARSPGSRIERENPKALVAPSYIRGSGTSQAAAVASGAAAVLLGARPGLTPDQAKAALVRSAVPLAGLDRATQGAGRASTSAALTTEVDDVVDAPVTALGTGGLDASRGSSARVQVRCGDTTKVLDDETTAWCVPWAGQAWTGQAWTGQAWTGQAWTGQAWTGDAWSGQAWTGADWTGQAWTGQAWTGQAWTGQAWTGQAWTGQAWTGQAWTSVLDGGDGDFLTGFWGPRPGWRQRVAGEQSEPVPSVCLRRTLCL